MARLFKRSDKPGSSWFADYIVALPNGRSKRRIVSTKTPDKATAKQILAKLQSEAAVRHHGLVDPLADQIAKQAARSVEEHLVDFKNKMTTAGRTEDHINRVQNHVKEYEAHAECNCVGDFSADTANAWAASLKSKGMSARTIAARLTSIKSFSKWLTNHDKLARNPFASLSKPNAQADRRRERRMLLPDEWTWLMQATDCGVDYQETPASERQLVYRLAIQTGLRSNEIRSLGRGHFHLKDGRPFVKVISGDTKNRKVAHQYVDDDLAADLRQHLRNKLPGAAAFSLPSTHDMADMLRTDLEAARRLWLRSTDDPEERANRETKLFLTPANEAGEVLDFHALRHTCGAWLARRGVEAKVIQSVMRHCSITLTFDTYGHLIAGAEAAAVQSNADMTAVPKMLAATGTDGMPASGEPKKRFKCASLLDAKPCVDDATPCESEPARQTIQPGAAQKKTPQNAGSNASRCDAVRADASTQGGTRTRKDVIVRGILSPLCLPIPPPGQVPQNTNVLRVSECFACSLRCRTLTLTLALRRWLGPIPNKVANSPSSGESAH